jgi:uncharacterized protein
MEQAVENWDDWGRLAGRYREPARRRILALDGGGIRGLITLGVLAELESKLAAATGRGSDFRLSEFFDLVGGTSTGAIIAACLAREMTVSEITTFYRDFGRKAFAKRPLWERWQSLYGDGELAQTLRVKFGEETNLFPEHLGCILVVVTRNATTDSAWPISSNPFAKYNARSRPDCNLKVPLWQLVRASTAAPVYFTPEVVRWDPDDESKAFAFVDGGTTAYNNPAFLLFRMAVEPSYKLAWERGEDRLLLVSVGTGGGPVLGATAEDPNTNLLTAATNTLSALMSQASVDQDINCRVIGRCSFGGIIDREVDDLIPGGPLTADTGKAFLYCRYNADLTEDGLRQLGLSHIDPAEVRKMDSVDHIAELEQIGRAVGALVDLEHLGAFV